MTETIRDIAEELQDLLFEVSPFSASVLGVPGYDAEVPDASRAGEERTVARLREIGQRAAAVEPDSLADRITRACVDSTIEQLTLDIEMAAEDHVVTAMPFAGPAALLAIAARTVITDAQAADDYVTRLQRSGTWIDQQVDRLREGAATGRVPVAPLVAEALDWIDGVLTAPVPAALLAPQPAAEFDGVDAWRDRVAEAGRDVIKPALARWRSLLADELLPVARPETAPGLAHLPSGDADYARAIQIHTTLPLTAEQLHRIGVEEIERLEARALELGATIGLTDLPGIHEAMRAASRDMDPTEAMAAATDAVRRAEARAGEVFPDPLPPPCVVTPMPPAVADSGMAPHYTPPRLDGGRPGTYWFNTARPTAGAGWDLEVVAFHEAVPGHHLQLSRLQLLTDLPRLQRQRSVTVHSEGWGLYTEQLAEEIDLYTGVEAKLGAVSAALMRAARLVLDTGLHALGWSRQQALDYYTAHVPMPTEFLANEIDRYITIPGQALAYQTGKREILRLRDEARAALGDRFTLPAFHAAVLDSGSLPMPALATAVGAWVESA